MAHVTDYKRDSMLAIVGGANTNIDDLEIAYLQLAGATSDNVNKAWMEVFVANGATSSNWNAAANEFLIALGAPSTNLTDNWDWFWVTNGGAVVISWEYATLALAEASGDAWIDGDDVTITGGAVFVYHSALAVNGYSGLIHKEPYGSGNGTISASVVRISEVAGADPDAWTGTWVEASGGTNGVDYVFDVDAGESHLNQTSITSNIELRGTPVPVDTECFSILSSIRGASTGTTDDGLQLNYGAFVSTGNWAKGWFRQRKSNGNWWTYVGTTYTDTGIDASTDARIYIYIKNGQITVWDDSSSAPLVSTGSTEAKTSFTYQFAYKLGNAAASGGQNQIWVGTTVFGGMTTA